MALLKDGQSVPVVTEPGEVDVILDQTPFYAEMGGQLADHGTIQVAGGGFLEVQDVQAPLKGLHVHRSYLSEGTIALDDQVVASIDTQRRIDIARSHTSTHMVHKALHEFLGEQATQAGSENSPSRMRFDFRHGSAVPAEVLSDIEARVNDRLQDNLEVTDEIMDIDDARKAGAMALFGEKYGKEVRVVSVGGDWSKELCAGTHVHETGQIGLVSVLGEASIGSGVRRIDALVGDRAYEQGAKERALVSQISSMMGVRADELPDRIDSMLGRLKTAEKLIGTMRRERLAGGVDAVVKTPRHVGDADLYVSALGEVDSADDVRTFANDVRGRLDDHSNSVVVITGVVNGRPSIVVTTTEGGREHGIRAGRLVSVAGKVLGGGGGGRDDIAQGGGTDASKIDAAQAAIESQLG